MGIDGLLLPSSDQSTLMVVEYNGLRAGHV